ncbi:unnamed protein product, partial [Heterosigma akashiwo]
MNLGDPVASADREISSYALKRMDEEKLRELVGAGLGRAMQEGKLGGEPNSEEEVDGRVRLLTRIIWESFTEACPKKKRPPWRRSVPWWSPKLGEVKRVFYRAKKRRFRSVGHMADYEEKRRAWRTSYRRAKQASWRKTCMEAGTPWGLIYRVLKGTTSNPVSTVKGADGHIIADPEESVRYMMNSFWPEDAEGEGEETEVLARLRQAIEERARAYEEQCRRALPDKEEPPYTEYEVRSVTGRARVHKAPGPDMICGQVLQALTEELLPHVTQLYNAGLALGYHPRPWKGDLEKAAPKADKKDYTVVKAYRLLSLTDELGKDQERL